jgi:hypothetical protein
MLAHTGLDRYGITKMAELIFKSFNAQYFPDACMQEYKKIVIQQTKEQ